MRKWTSCLPYFPEKSPFIIKKKKVSLFSVSVFLNSKNSLEMSQWNNKDLIGFYNRSPFFPHRREQIQWQWWLLIIVLNGAWFVFGTKPFTNIN